jgi:hypothetical protein
MIVCSLIDPELLIAQSDACLKFGREVIRLLNSDGWDRWVIYWLNVYWLKGLSSRTR